MSSTKSSESRKLSTFAASHCLSTFPLSAHRVRRPFCAAPSSSPRRRGGGALSAGPRVGKCGRRVVPAHADQAGEPRTSERSTRQAPRPNHTKSKCFLYVPGASYKKLILYVSVSDGKTRAAGATHQLTRPGRTAPSLNGPPGAARPQTHPRARQATAWWGPP